MKRLTSKWKWGPALLLLLFVLMGAYAYFLETPSGVRYFVLTRGR